MLDLQYIHAQHLYFETLNTRQGLSRNDISCVYEDKKGFIWVGTRDGLNKFDGRVFKKFRNNPADSSSPSSNNINAIIEDREGIFWIATKDGGLTRYDENAPDGHNSANSKTIPKIQTALPPTGSSALMIGMKIISSSAPRPYRAYSSTKKHCSSATGISPQASWSRKSTKRPTNAYDFLQHIEVKDSNTIYISLLLNEDLLEVDKRSGSFKYLHHSSGELLSIGQFFVNNHKIWMSAWNPGLFVQNDDADTGTKAKKLGKIDDLLMCVCDFNSAFLLAGTRSSGMYMVDKKNGDLIPYKKIYWSRIRFLPIK